MNYPGCLTKTCNYNFHMKIINYYLKSLYYALFVSLFWACGLSGQLQEEQLNFGFTLWTLFSVDSIGMNEAPPDFGQLYYRNGEEFTAVRLDYNVRLQRHTYRGPAPFAFYRLLVAGDGSESYQPVMQVMLAPQTREVLFITVPPIRREMPMFTVPIDSSSVTGTVMVVNTADSEIYFNVDGKSVSVGANDSQTIALSGSEGFFAEVRVAATNGSGEWNIIYSRRHPRPTGTLVLLLIKESLPSPSYKLRSLVLPVDP